MQSIELHPNVNKNKVTSLFDFDYKTLQFGERVNSTI